MSEMATNKKPTLRDIANEVACRLRCNCDLDNWQPEPSTGHSLVCRINKEAWAIWIAQL
jgi:hypothetical protein